MNAEQLPEHYAGVVAEQDPCLTWVERELAREPSAKLYSRQQDGGR